MTRLTVNIDNSKSEEIILAVIQALGLSYEVDPAKTVVEKPLNKAETAMYKRLKKSFEEINLHQAGKLNLKTIEEVIAELS